jgi:hypothetical protein
MFRVTVHAHFIQISISLKVQQFTSRGLLWSVTRKDIPSEPCLPLLYLTIKISASSPIAQRIFIDIFYCLETCYHQEYTVMCTYMKSV